LQEELAEPYLFPTDNPTMPRPLIQNDQITSINPSVFRDRLCGRIGPLPVSEEIGGASHLENAGSSQNVLVGSRGRRKDGSVRWVHDANLDTWNEGADVNIASRMVSLVANVTATADACPASLEMKHQLAKL
jgi:hypothetical protein